MSADEEWTEGPDADGFTVDNLPYCVFSLAPGGPRTVGVGIGTYVLDVAAALDDTALAAPSLNRFLAMGRPKWTAVRGRLGDLLAGGPAHPRVRPHLVAREAVTLHLPVEIGDFVDFYSSLAHALNLGRILRPGTPPLPDNWRYLPSGYHSRAGSVVVSGTPVTRPCGQRRPDVDAAPTFGPSERFDIETEVAFVVGVGTAPGDRVDVDAFSDHVFGLALLNDWSARDLQAWEYTPLGPFLGKSFATSLSPWVIPLEALGAARVPAPEQDPLPLPYLVESGRRGFDLRLEVRLNGEVISRPPFAEMYWTPAQQLAHLTANGAPLRTGDIFASGTVSGPERAERGSLIELAWNGAEPITLADGSTRTFLADGDTVSISGTAPGLAGGTIGLGEVRGTVLPALG